MRTQTIQMNLTQKQLDPILFRTEETGREIEFTLLDPDGTAYDLTDYDLKFSMLKPDGNFIYQDLSAGILTQTEQMTTSRGIGYYAIRVSDQDTLIYTGQGKVVIDDHVITDETLESISEVDGLIFPDDFLTVDDHVAVIDDDVTSTDTTWSSSKINDEIENASVIVSKTAEGNPIELTDAADAPLVKCVTDITGYQSGTGTPSPDNVRPIVAYTEGTVEVRGKNLLKNNKYLSGNTLYLGENANNTFSTKLKAGTYKLSYQYNGSGTPSAYYQIDGGGGNISISNNIITVVSDCVIRVWLYKSGIQSSEVTDFQLELGTSATDYEPYTSTTHTTTFPSEIYQGSEDVVNGETSSEWLIIDLGDLTWTYASSSAQFRSARITGIDEPADLSTMPNAICEIYETIPYTGISTANNAFTVIFASSNDHGKIYVKDSRYTDATAFRAAVSGIKLAYKLATPTTSSVTPTNLPIKSLSGYTHIESSTGDMEVEYITEDFQPIVDLIEQESGGSRITKLWDAGFTPSPGVWLEYDFGENLENYDAIVILFVVSGWEGECDSVTIYPKIQHLNSTKYYHYIKGTDYGIQFWRVSGTTYGLGSIDGNYPPQYKAVYGIKY